MRGDGAAVDDGVMAPTAMRRRKPSRLRATWKKRSGECQSPLHFSNTPSQPSRPKRIERRRILRHKTWRVLPMTFEQISSLAQIVASIGVVVSLIFVGLQIRQ